MVLVIIKASQVLAVSKALETLPSDFSSLLFFFFCLPSPLPHQYAVVSYNNVVLASLCHLSLFFHEIAQVFEEEPS